MSEQSNAWDTWVGSQTVEQFMALAETDDAYTAVDAYIAGCGLFDGVSAANREALSGLLQDHINQEAGA